MKDKELILEICNNLYPEADESKAISQKAFDLIDIFVKRYFDIDFAQLLIDSLPVQNDIRKTALILDILVWSTPDNGEKMDKLTSDWLYSGDVRKVKSILFREDWLPSFGDWLEVKANLNKHFPELVNLIDYHDREIQYWQVTGKRNMDQLRTILKTLT